jgi:hypothetical protein
MCVYAPVEGGHAVYFIFLGHAATLDMLLTNQNSLLQFNRSRKFREHSSTKPLRRK